jgi:hypothetical protein
MIKINEATARAMRDYRARRVIGTYASLEESRRAVVLVNAGVIPPSRREYMTDSEKAFCYRMAKK